ncbi:MAG: hypothetical protein R3E86_10515 [Pseudomonadales bacterium]
MNVWPALLRREFQEHKAGFFWTPLAILALVAVLGLFAVARGGTGDVSVFLRTETTVIENGQTRSSVEQREADSLIGLVDIARMSDAQLRHALARGRGLLSQPFVLAHFVIALFVLGGALYDERRDRSVLFFKSMPVGDAETVLSKLLFVVWVAPVISVAAIIAAQLLLLCYASIYLLLAGLAGAGQLWVQSGIGSGALELMVGLLVQGLWTLPLYAWLLLVSAAAPRLALVWAALIPLALVLSERIVAGTSWLKDWLSPHMTLAALPHPGQPSGMHPVPRWVSASSWRCS